MENTQGNTPQPNWKDNPLMQTLVLGQRKFSTVVFPPIIRKMQGRDFVRQVCVQKVNMNLKQPFGQGRPSSDTLFGKKFHSYCLESCTEEEKKIYDDPISLDPSADAYRPWERRVRNLGFNLEGKIVRKYLKKYNETATTKRDYTHQGKTVGAIVDMIMRGNPTGIRRKRRASPKKK